MKKNLVLLTLIVSLSTFAQSEILVPYRVGNKWGYSDTLGKLKIPARFDQAFPFDYNYRLRGYTLYASAVTAGKTVVLNDKGKEVFSGPYSSVQVIYHDDSTYFFIQNKQGKEGVRSLKKQLVPIAFERVHIDEQGNFEAFGNNKLVRYSKSGKLLPKRTADDDELVKAEIESVEAIYGPAEDIDLFNKVRREYDSVILKKYAADRMLNIDSITTYGRSGILYKGENQAILIQGFRDTGHWFFSKEFKVKNVIVFGGWDRIHFQTNAFLILDSARKQGVKTLEGKTILPFDYDRIFLDQGKQILQLESAGKYGFFIFHTVYPHVPPKYDSITERLQIPVNNQWSFALYKVIVNGKEMFVGENGVEYYKNK